ncbi:MAG TPA: hypothetical protein VMY05_00800 [Acidobacteriota bacterium]|nr:hypothetical protein [Acidobacteriota bacterium]
MDGLAALESNGVTAYVDPFLRDFATDNEGLHIDYVTGDSGRPGYLITIGGPSAANCSPGDCCPG